MTRLTAAWVLVACIGIFTCPIAAQDNETSKQKTEPPTKQTKATPPANDDVPVGARPSKISDLDSLNNPQTTEEYWALLDRELKYGKQARAKEVLAKLLARPDLKEKALDLREKYGSEMFIRFQADPELRKMSQELVDFSHQASIAKFRDTARIDHFLENLEKTEGERVYAQLQLRRAGTHAIPRIVNALKVGRIKKSVLMRSMTEMDSSAGPAIAALLESGDEFLIDLAIDSLARIRPDRATDNLWFVSANPKNPLALRTHAREVIAQLTGIPSGDLPSASVMLTRLAERFYQREIILSMIDQPVEVWSWEGDGLTFQEVSPQDAEEFYCIKAARQAIGLDPRNDAAKITLLSMALDRAYARHGVDQPLPATKMGIQETTLTVGDSIASAVLAKAIKERRTAVVLGATHLLAWTGKAQLLRSDGPNPSPIVEALNYPNARVQFAAAIGALEMRPKHEFKNSSRIVQTLLRSITPDTQPLAYVLDSDQTHGNKTASVLAELGYATVVKRTGRSGFDGAANSAAVDLVLIEPTIRDWFVEETVANFRADARTSGTPIMIFARPDMADKLQSIANRYRGIILLPRVEDTPVAIVLDENKDQGAKIGSIFQEFGFSPQTFRNTHDLLLGMPTLPTAEIVFISPLKSYQDMEEVVASLRRDAGSANLPIVITDTPELRYRLDRLAEKYLNVFILTQRPERADLKKDLLTFAERNQNLIIMPRMTNKQRLSLALKLGFNDPVSKPLTAAEKAANQKIATDWLLRLARGEVDGIDISPASEHLGNLLLQPEIGGVAAEALSYLPSAANQAKLASAIVQETVSLNNRIAAANALARMIQRSSNALNNEMTNKLVSSYERADSAPLRVALARVVGNLNPTETQIANRVINFRTMKESGDTGTSTPKAETKSDAESASDEQPEKPTKKPSKSDKKDSKKDAKKKSFFDGN